MIFQEVPVEAQPEMIAIGGILVAPFTPFDIVEVEARIYLN